MDADPGAGEGWTFFTNHAYVLLCGPGTRRPHPDRGPMCRDHRTAAQRILSELVEAGYLIKHRLGRRNFYEVQPHVPLRRPLDCEHHIGEILRVLLGRTDGERARLPDRGDDHGHGKEPDAQTE